MASVAESAKLLDNIWTLSNLANTNTSKLMSLLKGINILQTFDRSELDELEDIVNFVKDFPDHDIAISKAPQFCGHVVSKLDRLLEEAIRQLLDRSY